MRDGQHARGQSGANQDRPILTGQRRAGGLQQYVENPTQRPDRQGHPQEERPLRQEVAHDVVAREPAVIFHTAVVADGDESAQPVGARGIMNQFVQVGEKSQPGGKKKDRNRQDCPLGGAQKLAQQLVHSLDQQEREHDRRQDKGGREGKPQPHQQGGDEIDQESISQFSVGVTRVVGKPGRGRFLGESVGQADV